MTQTKKRPNKKAKAAQKILESSKLLATTKTINESKEDQAFKPNDSQIKTSGANKIKPHKKRG
ncbi:MAG: hypothetical protein ABIP06_06070 [Pyrinomonadaceae bacterium]